MNCIEARRMVTPYIHKELSDRETEQFLKHIEHCEDCMDELDIYFTVYKAMDTLESGTHHEYDFRKMLQDDIRTTKHGILRRKAFHVCRAVLLALAELLLILSVYTGYQIRRGEIERSIFQKAIYRLNYRRVESLEDDFQDLSVPENLKSVSEDEEESAESARETEAGSGEKTGSAESAGETDGAEGSAEE